MLSISLDQQSEKGLFFMCALATRRVRDLSQGAIPLVPVEKKEKLTTIALRELLGNKVSPVE